MLRHYLVQVLRHTHTDTTLLRPTLQHAVQQINTAPSLTLCLKQAEISLQSVIASYMAEMMKSGVWGKRAEGQVEDCFGVLTDFLGADYNASSVGLTSALQSVISLR